MANVLKSLSLCSGLLFSTMLVSCGVSGVLKNLNQTEEKSTKSNQEGGDVTGDKKKKDNPVIDNTVVDNTVVDNTVVDNTVVDNTVVVDPAPELTAASYALVKTTFETKCVTCHKTIIPIMNGLSDIKSRKDNIILHLDLNAPGSHKMPYGPDPMPNVSAAQAFADSSEGKKFFKWLKGEDITVVSDGLPKEADYKSTMKTIIDANCANCHKPGGQRPTSPMTNFEQVFNRRGQMAGHIENGSMPDGNSSWKNTNPGKQLIKWLKTGVL